jgi:hypothetical protein
MFRHSFTEAATKRSMVVQLAFISIGEFSFIAYIGTTLKSKYFHPIVSLYPVMSPFISSVEVVFRRTLLFYSKRNSLKKMVKEIKLR